MAIEIHRLGMDGNSPGLYSGLIFSIPNLGRRMVIEAVIFDMDGVLVDSERFICEAAMRMFAEKGVPARAEDFVPFVGMGENRYLGGVAEKHGATLDLVKDKARTYEIYLQIIRGRLEPLPGVHEFLARCRELGLKTAVASSADAVKVRGNLEEIGLATDAFAVCLNGNDVERKKPFPDIFITAAQRMGVDPGHCLVVEDAVSGVQAAKAAGAKCLALTTSFPAEKLAQADWISHTLADAPEAATMW